MNRELAFRIFGLNEGAGDANVRAARAALRAHLDARREAALALGHERAAAFYSAQLADVDAAATAIGAESLGRSGMAATGATAGRTQPGVRWVLGGVAGLGAVALIVWFFLTAKNDFLVVCGRLASFWLGSEFNTQNVKVKTEMRKRKINTCIY